MPSQSFSARFKMRLADEHLPRMTRANLIKEVMDLRSAIRHHRDQRLDDRCWMDDYELYDSLPEKAGKQTVDLRVLPQEQMMANCERYILCRSLASTPEAALELYRLRKGSNA